MWYWSGLWCKSCREKKNPKHSVAQQQHHSFTSRCSSKVSVGVSNFARKLLQTWLNKTKAYQAGFPTVFLLYNSPKLERKDGKCPIESIRYKPIWLPNHWESGYDYQNMNKLGLIMMISDVRKVSNASYLSVVVCKCVVSQTGHEHSFKCKSGGDDEPRRHNRLPPLSCYHFLSLFLSKWVYQSTQL